MTESQNKIWEYCLQLLGSKVPNEALITWIHPLQFTCSDTQIILYAHNQYVYDKVESTYLEDIKSHIALHSPLPVSLIKGSKPSLQETTSHAPPQSIPSHPKPTLNPAFTFDHFVTGNSNQLAYAAAQQVSTELGQSYNPLFIYGDAGMGKTHLMHAVGHAVIQQRKNILHIPSERFVSEMVAALQHNKMSQFKERYRALDLFLVDDVQFMANKVRTQDEFFHTFNAITDRGGQIIMTCDRYPKELDGLEERLKSRFSCGLVVAIEPPDLETRVAILQSKAALSNVHLNEDVAFFIAKRVRANVRELEGALKRVIASAHFTGASITLDFAHSTLKDLMSAQERVASIDNIQKMVCKHYTLKLSDIKGQNRSRHIVRPRQVAMYLAKELTDKSLPEIGESFGGKDHTTVLHAYRRIQALLEQGDQVKEDISLLMKILSH